ncbi:hypothetical protein M422DRAFT_270592 [Sphaerobolus stellatus SS14]|uniref:Uncharacterized protein n=1 Tax=Sphaerobolus stellatus (strain SS14) TaxID=990650 RepID=A0A0C9U241_SPHS4|nr:hypothetical protein M422DRAFT_270592 [Sphaerobolus stellatus SS14]
MDYRYPITEEQLALFLDAVKSLPIPVNEVPPPIIEEVPMPSTSKNPTILVMNQALIVEVIKLNASNVTEYEEWKEQWYSKEEEAKQRAEAVARKAEEAAKAAAKNADKEDEHVMDVNSEGENEVDQDNTLKSKSKSKRKKSHPIVESESEEETEEVKAKGGEGEGKGKGLPINYVGCPGVPVHKICKGCIVPESAKYQRPCVANVQMDVNDQIFSVRVKYHCFIHLMRNNVCLFTCEDEADFIMLEATNDEELQVKLKKLCNEQDTFQKQKDKEKAERNKGTGNNAKVGTNVKASGSTLKSSK